MKRTLFLLLCATVLWSCEDKYDLSDKLKAGEQLLVVDAFVNNLPEKQTILLSGTQAFYDNAGQKMVSGAVVAITDLDNSQVYVFTEDSVGRFVSSVNGDSLLKIGHSYALKVFYGGQYYQAYSKVNRVPVIDSLTFDDFEDLGGNKIAGKYVANLFATDLIGTGDRYWVRHYRNGKRRTEPRFVGVGYDAGGSANSPFDNAVFSYPLRVFYVNDNGEEKAWVLRETLLTELLSITDEAATFLVQMRDLADQGNGGPLGALFSPPIYNLPTNIKNTDVNGKKAVGFFCTSAVSRAQTTCPLPYYK
jgi:hypothetical protein